MAAEKQTATPTEYLVLRAVINVDAADVRESSKGWEIVSSSVTASSAPGAIRQVVSVLLQAEEQAGVFVAVPARSWKPTKVAPKTTVQLELTEVKP